MIEIENYQTSVDPKVVATFTIYISSFRMRIHNVRLVRTKNGNTFVSLPSYSTPNPDGTRKWHPIIEFSEEKNKEFISKTFEALKPFVQG